MRRIFLSLLLVFGLVQVSYGQLFLKELSSNYDNGLYTTTYAAFDTLIDNTDADTIVFGLEDTELNRNGAFPEFVSVFLETVENINNGESMTVLDEWGFNRIIVEGTLAVGDTVLTSTAGDAVQLTYNTSSASGGTTGEKLQLIINQLASAAATDCVSYRVRAVAVYRDKAR